MQHYVSLVCAALVMLLGCTDGMPEDPMLKIKEKYSTCKTRLNPPDDVVSAMMSTGLLNDESSEAGTCFVQCVMEELGIVKNGVFNTEDKLKEVKETFKDFKKPDGSTVDVEEITKGITECAAAGVGDTACAKNYRIWVCIKSKRQKAGLQ